MERPQGISENRFKEINSWKSWLVMTLQLILKIRYFPVDGTVHNQTGLKPVRTGLIIGSAIPLNGGIGSTY